MVLCGLWKGSKPSSSSKSTSPLQSQSGVCRDRVDSASSMGSGSSMSSKKSDRNARIAKDYFFPMHVMTISDFQELSIMTPHGELQQSGRLMLPMSDEVVHLASHQWLSFAHPDPDSVQLRRLQELFAKMAAGNAQELFNAACWDSLMSKSSKILGKQFSHEGDDEEDDYTAHNFMLDVQEGLLWLDYASIPQTCDANGDSVLAAQIGAKQLQAIWSIPRYVERVDYFWVLTPDAKHVDTGESCNFNTWRRRGWCRMEEWSNALAENRKFPLIISSQEKVFTMGQLDFITSLVGCPEKAVGNGDYSCCRFKHTLPDGKQIPCDKDALAKVLKDLYERRLTFLESSKLLYFAHLLLGDIVLAGTRLEPPPPSPDDDPEKIARRAGFHSLDDVWPLGIHPLHIIAAQAHPEVVAKAARLRPDLAVKPADTGVTPLMMAAKRHDQRIGEILAARVGFESPDVVNARMPPLSGNTALHFAAQVGKAKGVEELLRWRASIDPVRKDNGRTPLLWAAENGYPTCVQVLLRHRADASHSDNSGTTALVLAQQSLGLQGNAYHRQRQSVVALLTTDARDIGLRDVGFVITKPPEGRWVAQHF